MYISEKVIEILKTVRPEFEYTKELNLIEQGVLDSFDMMILTSELEKEFDVKIPGIEINSKNFKSVQTITSFINELILSK